MNNIIIDNKKVFLEDLYCYDNINIKYKGCSIIINKEVNKLDNDLFIHSNIKLNKIIYSCLRYYDIFTNMKDK